MMTSEEIAAEAIALVKGEWKAYENALVFVTDKVAFNIRNLIKQLRKNYWGIFDNDKDPITGQKMTWIPITEWICDTWATGADRDAKDIKTRAKRLAYVGLSMLARNMIQKWMSKNVFGEFLDGVERQMAIDGSTITKVYEGYDEDTGEKKVIKTGVDLLNTYFDMTVDSILDPKVRFTERALKLPLQMQEMDGWINTDGIQGTTNLHPTDTNLTAIRNSTQGGVKMVDCWETYGPIPKYLITGNKADKRQVYGHIVVSGIEGKGDNARVHLIETNPTGKKPLEEGHTKKIPGRWLARGPAESVMMLQGWVNMIVNIRKVRASVSQLGIWKLKKNGGVAPQNLTRMAANGVVQVNSMDDIEQLVVQEASQASYKDEEVAVNWAQRVTNSWAAITGEQTPASKSATSIVMEGNASKTTFTMYKKAIGFYLEKLMNNHVLPMLNGMLTMGEVVRLTGSPEELAMFDEAVTNCLAKEQVAKDLENGKKLDPEQVYAEIERVKAKMRVQGKDRFAKLGKIDLTKYDVEVYVGDEEFDASVQANNLVNMLKVVPQYQEQIVKELFDLMGMDSSKIVSKPPVPPVPGGQQISNPNPAQITANANAVA